MPRCQCWSWELEALWSLLQNGEDCDVVIQVEDQCFPAHKVILKSSCLFFAKLLGSSFNEAKGDGPIKVTSVSAEAFRIVLRYMYVGDVKGLSPNLAAAAFSAADFFGLEPMQSQCIDYLSDDNITVENCCEVANVTAPHSEWSSTFKDALEFISEHLPAVLRAHDGTLPLDDRALYGLANSFACSGRNEEETLELWRAICQRKGDGDVRRTLEWLDRSCGTWRDATRLLPSSFLTLKLWPDARDAGQFNARGIRWEFTSEWNAGACVCSLSIPILSELAWTPHALARIEVTQSGDAIAATTVTFSGSSEIVLIPLGSQSGASLPRALLDRDTKLKVACSLTVDTMRSVAVVATARDFAQRPQEILEAFQFYPSELSSVLGSDVLQIESEDALFMSIVTHVFRNGAAGFDEDTFSRLLSSVRFPFLLQATVTKAATMHPELQTSSALRSALRKAKDAKAERRSSCPPASWRRLEGERASKDRFKHDLAKLQSLESSVQDMTITALDTLVSATSDSVTDSTRDAAQDPQTGVARAGNGGVPGGGGHKRGGVDSDDEEDTEAGKESKDDRKRRKKG